MLFSESNKNMRKIYNYLSVDLPMITVTASLNVDLQIDVHMYPVYNCVNDDTESSRYAAPEEYRRS